MFKEETIWRKRGIILAIFFLHTAMAKADRIHLHDGTSISGEIIESMPGASFTLKKEDESIRVFKMSDVWKVKFEEDGLYKDKLYLKDGSIIIGNIIGAIPGETYKIKTEDGSVLVFKMDETERIEFFQKVKSLVAPPPAPEPPPVQPSPVPLRVPEQKDVKPEDKKLELSGFCGVIGGEYSPVIGHVIETGESIKVEIGGGYSIGVGLKVSLTPSWKLYSSLGYAEGGLDIAAKNVTASFTRYPLKLGIVYETKSEGRVSFYFGPAIGIYFQPVYTENWSSGSFYNSLKFNYKGALGFDGIGGVKWVNALKTWFLYGKFWVSSVRYSFDKGVIDGDPVVMIGPAWKELDGGGLGLFLGLGTYIPIK